MATPNALTDKNLFAYCDNNPVMRVDVGGEFWVTIAIGAAVGAIIGATSNIVAQVSTGQEDINWVEVGISAVSGAVGGAINAVMPNMGVLATGLVQGTLSATTYAAVEKFAYGREPNLAGVIISGVTSGIAASAMKAIGQKLASKYLENIVKAPQQIQGQSIGKVQYAAELSPDWEAGNLTRGSHAGQGWKANANGDWLIQWHPGSRWHFNGAPYWKVSSGARGIFRCPY